MSVKCHELIAEASKLYQLQVEGNKFYGLLYPVSGSVFSYNQPAVYVEGGYSYVKDKDKYLFYGRIKSIDDSGLTLYAPYESEDKARTRFERFFQWVDGLCFKCPSVDEVKEFCDLNGLTPGFY